jgi:hypothetical protein
MTFENDPNRRIDPTSPGRSRFDYAAGDGFGWLPAILAVAAIVLLVMLLLPSRDTSQRVTQNAPGTEQSRPMTPTTPTTPPANRPTPTPQQ